MTGLRQFAAGGENHGRAAALAGIAYTIGEEMRDDRNGRRYQFDESERVLMSGLFLPKDAPEAWRRENFASNKDHQQFIWTSLARHEEKQARRYARGSNKPIISRADILILDKRIFLDKDGKPRPDGIDHAYQVVRDFLRENYTRKGLMVSFAIHDQTNGDGNFHAHIVSSYRTLTADGWGDRKRPFGKFDWAVWAKEKQNSALKIQTRKLEAIGVIPKAERVSNKRETLTVWKIQKGFTVKANFQPLPKSTSMNSKSAPVPMSRTISASRQPSASAFVSTLPTRSIAFAAPSAVLKERDENHIQFNPDNAGSGYSGGGSEGVDFGLSDLQGRVADASERLKAAIQNGVGIAIAQSNLAAAKFNLMSQGGRGKGRAKGGAVRPKFKGHQQHRNQHPDRLG